MKIEIHRYIYGGGVVVVVVSSILIKYFLNRRGGLWVSSVTSNLGDGRKVLVDERVLA